MFQLKLKAFSGRPLKAGLIPEISPLPRDLVRWDLICMAEEHTSHTAQLERGPRAGFAPEQGEPWSGFSGTWDFQVESRGQSWANQEKLVTLLQSWLFGPRVSCRQS